MGMPISSYTVFRALSKGGKNYEIQAAKRALEPFNFFAFVIHDPEIHCDFDRSLTKMFDRLDFDTGSKLLFFALIKPPGGWLEHAQRRDYYRALSSWEASKLSNPNNAPITEDYSVTAFSIANALNIPHKELPCIVVTRSFELNQFKWVKTSSSLLGKQLSELGYLAERQSDVPKIVQELQNLSIHDEKLESISLTSSLAEALTDVLCFVVAGNEKEPWLRKKALKQVSNTLNKLLSDLSRLKHKESDPDLNAIDKLCVCITSSLSQLSRKVLTHQESGLLAQVNQRSLEYESFIMLRTAEMVFDLFNGDGIADLLLSSDVQVPDEIDFSPVIICLAKVFENEMNLSVVHWIRQKLGIQLPQYFNKRQRHVKATITPQIQDGREIDFNMGRRNIWLPPGIGQSELACKDLSSKSIPEDLDKALWDLLLEKWAVIRKKRNFAAHAKVLNRQAMFETRQTLLELMNVHLFDKTYNMKQRYSGLDR